MKVQLVAIARDSPKKLSSFAQRFDIQVRMLADRKGSVVKDYKVYTTGSKVDHLFLKFSLAIPTTYLINQEGIITWRYVGNREDRPSMDLLTQAITENLPDYPH